MDAVPFRSWTEYTTAESIHCNWLYNKTEACWCENWFSASRNYFKITTDFNQRLFIHRKSKVKSHWKLWMTSFLMCGTYKTTKSQGPPLRYKFAGFAKKIWHDFHLFSKIMDHLQPHFRSCSHWRIQPDKANGESSSVLPFGICFFCQWSRTDLQCGCIPTRAIGSSLTLWIYCNCRTYYCS